MIRHDTCREKLIRVQMEMSQSIEHDASGCRRKFPASAGTRCDRIDCPRFFEMRKSTFRIARVFESGSAPISGVGFGVSPKRILLCGSPRKRDAFANARDGRAPRIFLACAPPKTHGLFFRKHLVS